MPKKETQNTGQEPEKIVTKYDLKIQRRKELKEREKREERISRIVGIALVVILVGIVASFPIRNYLTINGTYATVNGEKISRVEFDFNYQVARSSYLNQYGAYLSYFGLDTSRDIDSQMYSDTLTWGDYFDELAVQNIARTMGLEKEARGEGFTYDVAGDYNEYRQQLADAATEGGTTVKNYIKQLYGPYATEARIKPCLERNLYVNAYSEAVAEKLTPGQEDIQAYYDEHTASYDSVDYYKKEVNAELPTEPTELADPQDDTEEEGGDQGGEGSEESTEEAYQPSEAEIAAAMEKAKEEADRLEKDILTDGEAFTNAKRSAVSYMISDWLFDEERKQGDTTVIEDSSSHKYYVVGFESRYLDETPTANLRVALTGEDNGQAILDEWKGGAATEESFAEICDKYNDPEVTSLEGGLLEGAIASDMPSELAEWIGDSARAAGDTAVISPAAEQYTYVLYYVGAGDAEWIQRIRTTILNERVSEYMDAFTENVDVEDPKGNLPYLKIREEEAAASQSEAESSSGEESGSGDAGASSGEESGSGEAESSSGEESGSGDAGASSSEEGGSSDAGVSSGEESGSSDAGVSSGEESGSGEAESSSGEESGSGDD